MHVECVLIPQLLLKMCEHVDRNNVLCTFDENNNGCSVSLRKKKKKNDIFFKVSILLLESLRSFLILRFMKENEMKNNFSLLLSTFNMLL